MDPVAGMLSKLDSRGLHGVLGWDLKVQLDEFVAVEAVIRPNNVGIELEQIIVLERDEVVWVFLLELLTLLGHSFCSQTCRHSWLWVEDRYFQRFPKSVSSQAFRETHNDLMGKRRE